MANCEQGIKSPKSEDSSSSSATATTSNASENGNSKNTNETTPVDESSDEIKINLNDFLDFLKVSCHVNDMITDSVQMKTATGATVRSSSKSATNVDFEKLQQNPLVNDLFGHRANNNNNRGGSKNSANDSEHNAEHASGVGVSERLRFRRRTSSVGAPMAGRNNSSKKSETRPGLHPKLNEKLDYVINEGVMDSILPFICPVQLPNAFSSSRSGGRSKQKDTTSRADGLTDTDTGAASESAQSGGGRTKEPAKFGKGRRLSLFGSRGGNAAHEKKEAEVVIHVCDEVKNTSRDFSCPQNLLVSKMGYFADVTAGQKLEDMDISVHCDIQIFDWLMRWVKRSGSTDRSLSTSLESGPQLDASNVVPILVSASFLQMEPLLLDCLSFCHARLSDVVRTSTNLSCLNDSIVTRLAAMFTNVELEMVRDKKERVTPRLWTKLIQSLCEPEPEAIRGHYYSLAGLFRCSKCGKCLTNTMKSYINCLPSNIRVNRWGQIVSYHVRDTSFDAAAFITHLFKELKSWRRVYWKLWGHCHFLYCCICEMHFPVFQMTWCRYHPEAPQFLGPVTEGRIAGPAGRYPCCGQQAFRFETLPGPNGCQFREHSVLVETDRERAIHSISQLVGEGFALYESPPLKLQEIIASGDIESRWTGLSLTPQRCRQGLLPSLNPEESCTRVMRRTRPGKNYYTESSSDSDTSDTVDEPHRMKKYFSGSTYRAFSTSSDGCESECAAPKVVYNKKKGRKGRQTDIPGRHWSGELSARSNQDHQREFEEKVMKQVISIVNKKTGSEHSLPAHAMPMGGSYVRLESEWKDQLKQRHTINNNNSSISSNSNCNSNTGIAKQRNK